MKHGLDVKNIEGALLAVTCTGLNSREYVTEILKIIIRKALIVTHVVTQFVFCSCGLFLREFFTSTNIFPPYPAEVKSASKKVGPLNANLLIAH